MLLGSGPTLSLFCIGQINLSNETTDLYLQKTRLGWIIGGTINMKKASHKATCNLTDLQTNLEKSWEIEEGESKVHRSKEEIECRV